MATPSSPLGRSPMPVSKASILKSKRRTRLSSFSQSAIAASVLSTPQIPERFPRRFHPLHLPLPPNHLWDHSPAAHRYFSPAKISNPALNSDLGSGSRRLPPSAPRKFKSPLQPASQMVAST